MNKHKRIVAFVSAAFVLGSGFVRCEDEKPLAPEKREPSKSAETPKENASKPRALPTKEDKEKAGGGAQRPASSGVTGGFAPHYGHENEQLMRQTLPLPKSTDEERKRRVDESGKAPPPAPK